MIALAGIGFIELLVIGGIFLLLLIVAGVILVVVLQRQSGRSARRDLGEPTAREILDRRLARGEIDEQEYDRLRTRLHEAKES